MDFDEPLNKMWRGYDIRAPREITDPDERSDWWHANKFEPPTGDGFQLWQTTGEGSPISPVFATLDELCEYAAEHCSTFADFKASKEEWMKMLGDGFVCHTEGNFIFF